jgi:hypothetical protein
VGPPAQGVVRPVTVTLPLNGLEYRNSSGTTRRTLFLDCELALALWRTADLWKARGVTAVIDYGIYNYRCIDPEHPAPVHRDPLLAARVRHGHRHRRAHRRRRHALRGQRRLDHRGPARR